jgi:hypothetical protein
MTELRHQEGPFREPTLREVESPRRRAVPRQPADWFGFYKFDDADNEPTRCCRVLDISPMGAGLELFATAPGENLSGLITVSVELHGNTRNVVLDAESHSARVGIEFDLPSPEAKQYLRRLNGVRSRW